MQERKKNVGKKDRKNLNVRTKKEGKEVSKKKKRETERETE
jgi:hypothetical protein